MTHPARVKGAALARLLTGETPRMVARAMGLPQRTIRRWQDEAGAVGGNGPEKRDEADRLGEYVGCYLDEALVTGRVLLAELRDPEKLHQLNARELAYIHGGLFDRALRMLAGIREGGTECP